MTTGSGDPLLAADRLQLAGAPPEAVAAAGRGSTWTSRRRRRAGPWPQPPPPPTPPNVTLLCFKNKLVFQSESFSKTMRTDQRYLCIDGSWVTGLSQGIPPTFLIRTNQAANIPVLRDITLFVMESNTRNSLNKVGLKKRKHNSEQLAYWPMTQMTTDPFVLFATSISK